jgi:hypothetical protein
MPRTLLVTTIFFGLTVLQSGCTFNPAVRFNNAIVAGTEKLHKAGESFGRAAAAALNSGKESDFAKLDASYDDAQKVLQNVKADIKALTVPPGQAAKELHAAAVDFFEQEGRRLDQDFREIKGIVKDTSLRPAQKQKRIQEVLERADKIEKNHLSWLNDAQRKFAQENHFTLKEK